MLKIVLIIVAIFVVYKIAKIAYLIINADNIQVVPVDYTDTVSTGGDIEAKYLKKGIYEVSYMEKEADESIKKYEIYYPKNIKNENNKFPVVVFVNGSGVRGSRYKALFEHLSSWGFVVVGNQEDTAFSGENANKTLEYVLSLNNDSNSVLYNKIDTDNIGITGHSQGGVGVMNAITNSKYAEIYKVAVTISPIPEESAKMIHWDYDPNKIDIPIMLLVGTNKDTLDVNQTNTLYSHIKSPKVMAMRSNTNHPDMLYSADGYVTAWLMYYLKNDVEAGKAFLGEDAEILNNNMYQNQKTDISE